MRADARVGVVHLRGVAAYCRRMAHYLFDVRNGDCALGMTQAELALAAMRVKLWAVLPGERHGDALAAGDHVLIYLGAPERVFLGSARLASAVHDWSVFEEQTYPGHSRRGVSLVEVEEWDPGVPMQAVLLRIGPSDARADFDEGVVLITPYEYGCALATAATV